MTNTDDSKVLWAEEMEQEMGLPPRQETIKDGVKTVVEYRFDEENERRVKVVTQYRIVRKQVPKAVALRKKWNKFGQSAEDPPGPNSTTTLISDEIKMQFVRNRAGELLDIKNLDDDPLTNIRARGVQNVRTCRYCKSPDHWTPQCPYKDMFEDPDRALAGEDGTDTTADARAKQVEEKIKSGTYVPPSMRAGGAATRTGATMMDRRDDYTVRVTNLPEDTTDQDLKELFSMTGKVQRIYLAKDKQTQRCKGFAFVTFASAEDAEKAIRTVSGHRYEHLILKVEWAKPSTSQ